MAFPEHSANPLLGRSNVAMSIHSTPVAAALAKGERWVRVRSAATLAAADPSPWNEATWAPDTYGVACDTYETVFLTAKFSAGGAASVRVSPMFFDPDTNLWMSPLEGGVISQSDPIDGSGNQLVEVRVAGMHCVFFRVSSLIGGPLTDFELAIFRGAPRGVAHLG